MGIHGVLWHCAKKSVFIMFNAILQGDTTIPIFQLRKLGLREMK